MIELDAVNVVSGPPASVRGIEQWRAIMDEQRRSGLSISGFCRERSIATSSFFAWRRKLGMGVAGCLNRQGPSRGEGGFAEVKLVEESTLSLPLDSSASVPSSMPTSPATLELRLPKNRRLIVRKGFDRDLLVALERTLEAL